MAQIGPFQGHPLESPQEIKISISKFIGNFRINSQIFNDRFASQNPYH